MISDFVEVGGKKIDQAEDLKARWVANPSKIALSKKFKLYFVRKPTK